MTEIPLVADWVAAAMAGTIVAGDRGQAFTGVSIDTRTVKAGELFIAIRGERFDGADFADAAIVGGAAGIVVPRGRAPKKADAALVVPVVIDVDDTTAALQALARAIRVASGS